MDSLWALIPIMALSIPFFGMWTKHKKDIVQMEIEAGRYRSSESSARDAAKIAELEERVRVLERIVTDGGYDTARQIEALRDRPVEELTAAPKPKGGI